MRARRLADALWENRDIRHAAMHDAVAAVPRHLLAPRIFVDDVMTRRWREIDTATGEGMTLAYSSAALVVELDAHHARPAATLTAPDVAVRTLALLDLRADDHVLEIGTGTGYTTALLCCRVCDGDVASTDSDRAALEATRSRLGVAGFFPALGVRAAADGWTEHGRYHRIVAHQPVTMVPWEWARQLTPDGRVLIAFGDRPGHLVALDHVPFRLQGRFSGSPFEPPLAVLDAPAVSSPVGRESATVRRTVVGPLPWIDHPTVWFLARFDLPPGVVYGVRRAPEGGRPQTVVLTAPDGSWAEVDLAMGADGTRTVVEAGPTPLWADVEAAYLTWSSYGEPDWPRFGLTVTPAEQWVWLDEPDGPDRWLVTAP